MIDTSKKSVTIAMYHYVRELPLTKYPKIKGLLASSFIKQLDYLERHYTFVTVENIKSVIYGKESYFPKNALLLTFDDAYVDHFVSVFPVLAERGIQGCFFPAAKSIIKNEVLEVNQIHHVMASLNDDEVLFEKICMLLKKYRNEYGLESHEYYYTKLNKEKKYLDTVKIAYIKALLQYELPRVVSKLILDELFAKYVSSDLEGFAKELYMNKEQLRCMMKNGMVVGNHGYDHFWMNKLTPEEQENDIDLSLNFLDIIGVSSNDWMMCFPHGAYDASLLKILRQKGCTLAVTIDPGIAELSYENSLTLQRLDTNEFPKERDAKPCSWTNQVIECS